MLIERRRQNAGHLSQASRTAGPIHFLQRCSRWLYARVPRPLGYAPV